MVAWPSTLPQSPLGDGWNEQLPKNRYEFQPRVGIPKGRPSSSQRNSTQTFRFKFTYAQKVIFENFYYDTLFQGTLVFDVKDPPSATTISFAYIGEAPTYETPDNGLTYIMSCTLIKVP